MNVFVLDRDHDKRAQYHCDAHVNKMLLESVQMLNTALYKNDIGKYAFYQPTHASHPWCEWAARSGSNWIWLLKHATSLAEEYVSRFEKEHASYGKVMSNWKNPDVILDDLPDGPLTPFPACTGDYKPGPVSAPSDIPSVVDAYRDYYAYEKYPQDWFSYSSDVPDWLLARL